jgi:DNA-binding MarR family transcriptional regulator
MPDQYSETTNGTLAHLGTHIPDDLLDQFEQVQRRLRPLVSRPPVGQLPMPSLGRPLDVAKLTACSELRDLTANGPVSVKDLADSLGLDHSTVSRLLGELEEDGLVERGSDPDDRRRRTITLTPLGHAVGFESRQLARVFARMMFADWEASDIRTLLDLMDRLLENTHSLMPLLKDIAIQQANSTPK